ncbi:hypothetical protein RJT34_01135 [Clitoria ternatea]|uniref:Cyclic nucleotide-binding domain-containing protein n=1 Tax=Clitoria ternatea TaxID=43366 RepID=A0AAN9PZN9_CLITE
MVLRFQDWDPESGCLTCSGRIRTTTSSVLHKFQRGLKYSSKWIKRFRISSLPRSSRTRKEVLDPAGSFLEKWNKIFVLSCLIAISLDLLFLFVPVIDDDKKCLSVDRKMEITATVLRSLSDIFYIIHMVFQFRTGFIVPSSWARRDVLVEDARAIAKRYLSSYFLIDILAVLPLPQVAILMIIPRLRGFESLNAKNLLKFIVFFQYVPRCLRIIPLYRTSGIHTANRWHGAAFNFSIYIIAGHFIGAYWYLFSIERETTCWLDACQRNIRCNKADMYCDDYRGLGTISTFLGASCPIQDPNITLFNFGIFLDALQSGAVESTNFPQKFFYCIWWGLRNLSSLGQNLATSAYAWENCFAIFISVSGLVFYVTLIGNMLQIVMQSVSTRLEEMRMKQKGTEQWMHRRVLPDFVRERIRRHQQYTWRETRGVDEDSLIHDFPKDIRREIRRHLCLELFKRVPLFEKMNAELLDLSCDRLKPVLYIKESYIMRENEPVEEMLFIMGGRLHTMTSDLGRSSFFNSGYLIDGDFCGEELLTWALDPHSSSNLPLSTRTVQTLSEVEAFTLKADDLKFIASQFRRLYTRSQLGHIFRFYSPQWRTWAACFIQAAWRRCCRRKLEESLREEEERLQSHAMANEAYGSSLSLGATLFASTFVTKVKTRLKTAREKGTKRWVPTHIKWHKPAEPDFTSQELWRPGFVNN